MRTLFLLLTVTMLSSCSSIYYNVMETFGSEKRDILVDRVKDAREEQQEAKEEFQSALERFSALVDFQGGELESNYNKLSRDYERCKDRADAVGDRIDSIESVAEDLFAEWEDELDDYSNDRFRRISEQRLYETQKRYDDLIFAMRRAESKMDPVLSAFQDHVLFLKHNLNANAIASLEGQVDALESDIASLISEMESSIAEADAFIDQMNLDE
ncbi:DUF2959 domain-containing protein [bacterium]|nr:DUF2959 domain-containing protein [bacterium]